MKVKNLINEWLANFCQQCQQRRLDALRKEHARLRGVIEKEQRAEEDKRVRERIRA